MTEKTYLIDFTNLRGKTSRFVSLIFTSEIQIQSTLTLYTITGKNKASVSVCYQNICSYIHIYNE